MACPLSGEGSGESDPGGAGRLASVSDGAGVEESKDRSGLQLKTVGLLGEEKIKA